MSDKSGIQMTAEQLAEISEAVWGSGRVPMTFTERQIALKAAEITRTSTAETLERIRLACDHVLLVSPSSEHVWRTEVLLIQAIARNALIELETPE